MAENINKTLSELTSTLSAILEAERNCCNSSGGDGIAVPHDGDVSVGGPNDKFEDQTAYFNAKCNASNAIYDTVKGYIAYLEGNNVDILAGTFGAVTSGLVVAAITSGPVGWGIIASGAIVAGLAGFLIVNTLNFDDINDAMGNVHNELVLALYNASSVEIARDNFITALDSAPTSTNSVEQELVRRYLLTNNVLNELFDPRESSANYQSSNPVDCGGAILVTWDFDSDLEGWTYNDLSDVGASADASYNAGLESIMQDLTLPATANLTAWLENVSPTISQAVTPGSSVQVDYSATSDGNGQLVRVTAEYSDASEESADVVTSEAGTLLLTLTQSKTIVEVRVVCARSQGGFPSGALDYSADIREVRIIGAS